MKKLLVLLLCINIVLAPTYALANTPLGGWTITQQIAQGASLALSATKTSIINGASLLKTSTAKITPNASQVAKVLRRGAAGYALSVAVEQLIGAVDWVLDPENNRIKYKVPAESTAQNLNDLCSAKNGRQDSYLEYYSMKFSHIEGGLVFCKGYGRNYNTGQEYGQTVVNAGAVPTGIEEEEQRYLGLDVVGQQVIDNANSGDTSAQQATTAAAQDMLSNDAATQSDVETQLNANATTQTSEAAQAEATPKDPAAPQAGTNIKITFPVFCGWAPIVCEAAQSAIKFPTTVENWWNTATQAISSSWTSFKEWLDWTKNDSELPETQTNEVTELPIPELQENAISWSASCPPDVQVPINLYGQSSTLTFSWSPWCQLLNIIKPAIIASAYIGAAFIVLGLRT